MRPKLLSGLFSCSALLASALLPASLRAQSTPALATPEVRITTPVTPGGPLVTLKGNTHPLALAQYDRGAAAATLPTGRLRLQFARSAAQGQALTEYMGSLHDPNSPSYHKWLTPESFGANFGISDADLQTVQNWLASQGFKVESVPKSRNFIEFSGNLGQVAKAFHTSIHTYSIAGANHLSNVSDPQIPAALAPVVAGVSPLNDFRAKPMHVLGDRVLVTAKNGSLQPVQQASSEVAPHETGTLGGQTFFFVTPADAATIYNAPNFLNRNNSGGTQQTGAGVSVGLVGDSDFPVADYLNYRKFFLNESSPTSPSIVMDGVDPGTNGNAVEALLDTEAAAGLAPGVQIYYYNSASSALQDGIYDAALRAVEDNQVALLSVSYGACEAQIGAAGNQQLSALWQQASAQGITVLVSTGDTGSAGCESNSSDLATTGLAVSGFASTPYNIAVGGTDFDVLQNNIPSQYVNGGANGGSAPYYGSALKYIPENPWNDSITNNPPGVYTSNTLAQYLTNSGDLYTVLASGSGGLSSAGFCGGGFDANGNCNVATTGYPVPSFQSGVIVNGAPATARSLPDVSLFASPGFEHQAGWAICADSTIYGRSAASTDCIPDGSGHFFVHSIGGTSASSPAFAGILAQVIQSKGGQRLGLANNILYNLGTTSQNKNLIFHDITAGNNSVQCAAGSLNCGGNGFLTGYNAGSGYDLATGLGSVDIAQLITNWDAVHFDSTTVTLSATLAGGQPLPASIVHGTPVKLSVQVSSPNGTPAGSVAITGTTTGQGGHAVVQTIPLQANGSGSVTVSDLPGGTYNVQAYYAGDVSHSPSTSSPAITLSVSPEASSPYLSVLLLDPQTGKQVSANGSVPYGIAQEAEMTPANTNLAPGAVSNGVATGTVTLNNGVTSNTEPLNSSGSASFPLMELTPRAYSFSGSYSGDQSYNPSSTSTSVPLTITPGATQLAAVANSTAIASSASVNVTVTLTTHSAGIYPSGPITLSGNGSTFAGSAVLHGITGFSAVAEQVTFTVPGAALANGVNTLTASYGGDGNYSGSSTTTTVSVSGGSTNPAFALTGPPNGISISAPGQSATGAITVTPTNGFSGAVNLTCQVQFTGVGSSPTCSLANSSVNLANGTAATTTVTVHTTAASASLTSPLPAQANPSAPALAMRLLAGGGGLAFCGVLLWGIPARRKGWSAMRSLAVAFLAIGVLGGVLGMTGCGGTSTSNKGSGTATGTYTLLVTGTSGSTTANTQISVTVQ